MSPIHALSLFAIPSWLAGCPAPSADDPGPDGCGSTADCGPGMACVDEACVPVDGDADAGGADAARVDAGPGAPCDEACEGECVDGACCPAAQLCGDGCCGVGQLCSFLRCVDPGGACLSADDCDEGEYCETQMGGGAEICGDVTAGAGRCLPRPPRCPDGVVPNPEDPSCVASCEYTPPADAFDVAERYAWGSYDGDPAEPNVADVRNSPIVVQLDDDDCDGRVTGRDVPEIVIVTAPGADNVGDLVVLSVTDGELREKWRVPGIADIYRYPAGGDIDGRPGNELVVCGVAGTPVRAFGVTEGGLVERWTAETPGGCFDPSLADLDQDGAVEVLVGGVALSGVDGSVRFTFAEAPGRSLIAMDVDGDPDARLEVLDGRHVYRLDGEVFRRIATGPRPGYPLVADLDLDGRPEIVSVDHESHRLAVWRLRPSGDVEVIRAGIDINGPLDPARCPLDSNGRTKGGGPPTAADVNGDGVPDIAVAGGVGYAVLDGARLMRPEVPDAGTFFWAQETSDCSSARTGSSVFDFNGDGRAEVLYADERFLRIYDGDSGDVRFETCNTNGTIEEMPVVADVDGDGQADVIVVANARYRSCQDAPDRRISGVRVFGTAGGRWVRTRAIWNQHSYHVTNVEADGTVPRRERPNHAVPGLNNFRQNRQPDAERAAVDAVVSLAPACDGSTVLVATVRNLGEAVLPPGARVTVSRGTAAATGEVLGVATTTRALYPAQAEELRVDVGDPALLDAAAPVRAEVVAPPGVPECRTDNDVTEGLVRGCLI